MITNTLAADVSIVVRTREFSFSRVPERWLATDEATQFMHALSVLVPATEHFVIQQLRKDDSGITSEQLRKEIKQVIRQEGAHARLHRRANQTLKKSGFTAVDHLGALLGQAFVLMQKLMPKSFLQSVPAAMEHFTSSISRAVLQQEAFWFNADQDNEAARFLKWHALEELEHQAVCYDVYKSLGNSPLLLSLSLLCFWMPLTALSIYGLQAYFLLANGHLRSFKSIRRWLGFVRGTAGLFFRGAWKYRKQDFTPWTDKDRMLHQSNIADELRSQEMA